MGQTNQKLTGFIRRQARTRYRQKRLNKTDRVRLSIFRSSKNIYAQLIDDAEGKTIASASSLDKSICKDSNKGVDCSLANKVGKLIAERALQSDINTAYFDRGGYKYHGRVKALADGAREGGLKI